MATERIVQLRNHLLFERQPRLSAVHGQTEPPLINLDLGALLRLQAEKFATREALVQSDTGRRVTFKQLDQSSSILAKGLLSAGVKHGDRVAIMAGNSVEYVELFFAAGRIGAVLVVLNNTYTPKELLRALKHTGTKLFFLSTKIGTVDKKPSLEAVVGATYLPHLEETILLRADDRVNTRLRTFAGLAGSGGNVSDEVLQKAEASVSPDDLCNMQFTSGTTGDPKAAMLTHNNIINNGAFIGDRMNFSEQDILACPPPLYHCFGLVLGLLAAFTHGSCTVFPSETFNPEAVVRAVLEEKCTACHGVPAMWVAVLEKTKPGQDFSRLRTGISAGSPTPRALMENIRRTLNLKELTNTYGMTETSPASFMTRYDDDLDKRLSTVGRIMPHTSAKIIDTDGKTVPIGTRGEIVIAGYLLQKGYWNNEAKTAEVMVRDSAGVRWMHTGDEGFIDEEGYCHITGRIKDIIIRGGENIFPLEIEERLVRHEAIADASVVGVNDEKYGEVVGAFLVPHQGHQRVDKESIREWVRQTLGRHKAPTHVFWVGDEETGSQLPMTGSGKIKKNVLRDMANSIVKKRTQEKS